MKFRRPMDDQIELNLTPLIDCLLFLIIFFLLSTTFAKTGKLQITLPQADAAVPAAKKKPLEVAVDGSGQYAVNGEILSANSPDDLRKAIEVKAGDNRDQPLIITADGQAPHQSVVTIMDIAGQLGFHQIGIGTQTAVNSAP